MNHALTSLKTATGIQAFAVSDRIQLTASAKDRKAREAGLANSTIGTIRAIETLEKDRKRVTFAVDGGKEKLVSFVIGNGALPRAKESRVARNCLITETPGRPYARWTARLKLGSNASAAETRDRSRSASE